MKKFSILLLTALLICALPLAAMASWLGSGTDVDPYMIFNQTDLVLLSTQVNLGTSFSGTYFELAGDIDLTGSWTPIGNSSTFAFGGILNGNGFVIRGLQVNTTELNAGLFGFTLATAEIRNLGVETTPSGVVSTAGNVGGLVGHNQGIIENSFVTGNVTGNNSVGGLVGVNISNSIRNSFATATVTGNDFVGGLVGQNLIGQITTSYATGDTTGNNNVGGLVGVNQIIGQISWSVAMGDVNSIGASVGAVVGGNGGTLNSNFRYVDVVVNGAPMGPSVVGDEFTPNGGSLTADELIAQITWQNIGFGFGGNPWLWQWQDVGYGFPTLPGATAWPFPFPYTASFYTVTFNHNHGTIPATTTQHVQPGAPAIQWTPTRASHRFLGWYTEATFVTQWDFSDPINSNITLFARWLPITFSLTPTSVTLVDGNFATVTIGVNAMGLIEENSPPHIEIKQGAEQLFVRFAAQLPNVGDPTAIISGPYTINVTREGVSAPLTVNVNIPPYTPSALTLTPAMLALVNDTPVTVTATGTETGPITHGALPANIDLTPGTGANEHEITVEFTGTMPNAGAPAAIISGPYTINVTRGAATVPLMILVSIPAYEPAPTATFTLTPSPVNLTNNVMQTAVAGGTATGAITVGTLTPANANIAVTPTLTGVNVQFTGTLPHAGAPAAITGSHTINVTRGGVTFPLGITVNIPAFGATVPVSSITVTGAGGATAIRVGQTLQMHANVLPANATNSAVTWSVLPGNGVATINAAGLLTAVGLGTVTVTATAVDGSGVSGSRLIAVTAVGGGGGGVGDDRPIGGGGGGRGGCNVASGLLAMLLMLPLFFVVKRKR